MTWTIEGQRKLPKLKDPVLIEGMPGIGNVGKVAIDFMIDELKAEKVCDFFSTSLPHSVFVNEDNLVELPTIELYCKRVPKGRDLLLLAGDVQPVDERSCYDFSFTVLDLARSLGVKEVVTLGGIGLVQVPKKPKVYCTGNSKKYIQRWVKGTALQQNLNGVVGPIIGVSGLLVGLAKGRDMDAVSILAETLGHPMYLGVKGAREILKVLNAKLELGIGLDELDKEIKEIELEMLKHSEEMSLPPAGLGKMSKKKLKETTYIG